MKKLLHAFLSMLFLCPTIMAQQTFSYSVSKIWDNDAYCAFTSLVKCHGKMYLAFHEGGGHVFDKNGKAEGKIRILTSKNGRKWQPLALIGQSQLDFRDPQLSIMPDGRLMLSIGVSKYVGNTLVSCIPHVAFSADGKTFTQPQPCVLQGKQNSKEDWLWKPTWHQGICYTVNYYTEAGSNEQKICLMTSSDGFNYRNLAVLPVPDAPSEVAIRFCPDGKMVMLIRRDAGDCLSYMGQAYPPYTQWNLQKLDVRLEGQDFFLLDDTHLIACSRYVNQNDRATSLFEGNIQTGKFHQIAVLPSAGDTSYPGLLILGKNLWISYYSGHETQMPSIYLAKIPMTSFKK